MQKHDPVGVIHRYARTVVRWRNPIVWVTLAVTLVLGFQLPHLHLDNRTRIWVPRGNRFVRTTQQIQRRFGIRNAVTIGIVPSHGTIFQPAVLREIQKIQRGLRALPESVHRNILSIAAPKVKAIHGIPSGMSVHRILSRVPDTAFGMTALRQRLSENPLYRGVLVSADHKTAAVVAAFHMSAAHPSYLRLYRKIQGIAAVRRGSGLKIYIAGAPVWNAHMELEMAHMPAYFCAAILIIVGLLYLSFRSVQGAVLPMITALLATVWALGLMALLRIPMDVLNSVTPILLMAVGTGHATQMLSRYYEEHARLQTERPDLSGVLLREAAIVDSLVQVGPVLLMAGIIAILAFLSLTLAPIAMIRHFGILTALGVGSVLFLEMTFMPALRVLLPSPPVRATRPGLGAAVLDRLGDVLAQGRAVWVLLAVFGLTAMLTLGVFRLHANNAPKDYFPHNSAVRRDNRVLNKALAGTGSIFFQVSTSAGLSIKDPAVLGGMVRLQRFLGQVPGVGKTQSVADLIMQMNQALHANLPAYYRIPKTRKLVAQYLFLYDASANPGDFDNLVDSRYQHATIWVYTHRSGTAFTEQLYHQVEHEISKDFPPGVRVRMGGGLPETMAINHAVIHEKLMNVAQMSVVVFLISALALQSWVGGLYVVLPLLLIVMGNFGIMGWLGLPLNMGTVTSASLAMGLGADYELYLLFRFREAYARSGQMPQALRESLRSAGRSVLFVTTAIVGGYSALLTAHFYFYTQLATMVIATMLLSLLLTLVLLRAMTVVFRPRFLFSRTALKSPETGALPFSDREGHI